MVRKPQRHHQLAFSIHRITTAIVGPAKHLVRNGTGGIIERAYRNSRRRKITMLSSNKSVTYPSAYTVAYR